MAINKLKKINVRSPYYITVDNVQEATVDPTEPVEQETTITCGSTTQVGVDVGTRTFKISTTGRELGDYDITFSGIKTPIKYRIGHSGNMPSYTTAGLDNFATEWNTATGESPALSDSTANPSGVSATATYTSTQSDIDTYGEEIQLEIQQPIITEDYSFSLSCPALAADEVPVDDGFVVIISFTRNWGSHYAVANELSVNGTKLGGLPSGAIQDTDRYVMTDQVPNLIPLTNGGYNFFNRNQFGSRLSWFEDERTGYNTSAIHKPESILSSGINELTVVNDPTSLAVSSAKMTVMISRHPVREISGTRYVLGSADGVKVRALTVDISMQPGQSFEMKFKGSNSTDLEFISAVKNSEYTQFQDEDVETINVDTIAIRSV